VSGLAVERRLVEAGGRRIGVIDEGPRGAPVVTFLHALGSNADLWRGDAVALADRFRVVSIDTRGHGASDVLEPAGTFDDLVADVVAVWDALGIGTSAVVGLSLGGMTAFGLALAHPDRVTGIIAADCRADAPEPFRQMWAARRAMLAEGGMAKVAEGTLPSWLTGASRSGRPDLVEAATAMIISTPPAGYRAITELIEGLDYKRRLAEITVPCRMIVGAEDGVHPPEMAAMAALVPDCRLVTLEGAAHLANLEQPAAFRAAVEDFLTEIAAEGRQQRLPS
jgi:3-oxoadipate enol-lactonase